MRTNKDFFELSFDEIDVGEVVRRIVRPEGGATVTLDGYVRRWTEGIETEYLFYEAYEVMALREMRKLARTAREQFEILQVAIVHRLGILETGETSVVIAVAAAHRRPAFAACEWLIQELKRCVPIWKKEVSVDGSCWIGEENSIPVLLADG